MSPVFISIHFHCAKESFGGIAASPMLNRDSDLTSELVLHIFIEQFYILLFKMITNFTIATITWARTAEEENLLRNSLSELAKFQIPTFITDGGSPTAFINFLKTFPNFTVLQTEQKGLWGQAKNSLIEAQRSGSEFILYSEPDKLIFFQQHLKNMIEEISVNENDGIVLASRSAPGFSSYPAFQQMTETTINNCCTQIIGKARDYTYGPFFLNNRLVQYVHLIKEEIGWGWRPFLFGVASRLGLTITFYEDDFPCAPDQQNDDAKERLYRMRQLEQNLRGILLAASIPISKSTRWGS